MIIVSLNNPTATKTTTILQLRNYHQWVPLHIVTTHLLINRLQHHHLTDLEDSSITPLQVDRHHRPHQQHLRPIIVSFIYTTLRHPLQEPHQHLLLPKQLPLAFLPSLLWYSTVWKPSQDLLLVSSPRRPVEQRNAFFKTSERQIGQPMNSLNFTTTTLTNNKMPPFVFRRRWRTTLPAFEPYSLPTRESWIAWQIFTNQSGQDMISFLSRDKHWKSTGKTCVTS